MTKRSILDSPAAQEVLAPLLKRKPKASCRVVQQALAAVGIEVAHTTADDWLLCTEHWVPEAREFLLASIDDEDLNHGATDTVFKGLRCFNDDGVRETVERVAYDETLHWTRRNYAWETLAFWKDPRARDFWLECLAGEDTLRRITAVTALSNYDDPEVWELIRHAAENDPDWQVVKEAQKQLDKREGE